LTPGAGAAIDFFVPTVALLLSAAVAAAAAGVGAAAGLIFVSAEGFILLLVAA
jgi:hypothetical protein